MAARWHVEGLAPHPDGYNDQGLWEGRSIWGMWRAYRGYRRLGFVVTVTRYPSRGGTP